MSNSFKMAGLLSPSFASLRNERGGGFSGEVEAGSMNDGLRVLASLSSSPSFSSNVGVLSPSLSSVSRVSLLNLNKRYHASENGLSSLACSLPLSLPSSLLSSFSLLSIFLSLSLLALSLISLLPVVSSCQQSTRRCEEEGAVRATAHRGYLQPIFSEREGRRERHLLRSGETVMTPQSQLSCRGRKKQ